jgi:hypothetical protein
MEGDFEKTLISDPSTYWEDVMEWGLTELKGKNMKATLCKLAWGRQCITCGSKEMTLGLNMQRTEEQILKRLYWEVRSPVMAKGRFKKTEVWNV